MFLVFAKALYFIFPSKQVRPSNLPQILDSDLGVNCTLGAVANMSWPMDGEPEWGVNHTWESFIPKPFGFSYPPCQSHPPPPENPLEKFPKCIWRWNSHSAFLHFALLGVVFCLDFSPFFFLLLFPLPGVFPLLICLFYPTLRDAKEILFCRSRSRLVLCIQGDHSPSLLPFPPSPIEGNFHLLLTSRP
jgi:hypothetical protein